MMGSELYRLADLGTVWVEGEVFEKDLGAVRTGQHATVAFEAYPGESFEGRVSYVYPSVSMEARTGREFPRNDQLADAHQGALRLAGAGWQDLEADIAGSRVPAGQWR